MKKLGPILLVVLLSVIVVLGIRVYQERSDAVKHLDYALRVEGENLELLEKYDHEERELLQEQIHAVMKLNREAENHRKSINHLRSKIEIKEDWMDNPQKYWKVNMSGDVVAVGQEVNFETMQGE